MNPNHALPVLVYKDDSGVEKALFESCAIVDFLTDALAGGDLAPPIGISSDRAEYKTLSQIVSGLQLEFQKIVTFANGQCLWMLSCPTG